MRPQDKEKYLAVFLENFNSAVTENALKWHSMEPRRGAVDYSVVDAILKWTDEHQIPLRGHNIFWGIPDFVQPWLKALPDAGFRDALRARAVDVGRRYRGRFAEYDTDNEMIPAIVRRPPGAGHHPGDGAVGARRRSRRCALPQ
jgi:GH35 family endo-1,4-beta-xylanase